MTDHTHYAVPNAVFLAVSKLISSKFTHEQVEHLMSNLRRSTPITLSPEDPTNGRTEPATPATDRAS